MICENIRSARLQKGLSQEELAARLHVVRQTVSKWEKGASLPDGEQLVLLAKELGTTAGALLGEDPVSPEEMDALRARLTQAEEELSRQRQKRIRKNRILSIVGLSLCSLIFVVHGLIWLTKKGAFLTQRYSVGIIGGADGPTSIIISDPSVDLSFLWLLIPMALLVLALVYLVKTRKK